MDDKRPAFQFYPQDYLSDVNVQAMTWAERGRYWHLVSLCWIQGSIPSDKVLIRRLLGASNDLSSESLDFILKCFKKAPEEGRLVHPRLVKEREKQDSFKKACSAGGKKSQAGRRKAKVVASTSKAPTNSSSLSSSSTSLKEQGKPSSPAFSEEDLKVATKIAELKALLHPNHKKPKLEGWANVIRLMSYVDKRSHEDIVRAYEWVMQDSFWSDVCLSPENLRRNWDKIQAKKSKAPQKNRAQQKLDDLMNLGGGDGNRRAIEEGHGIIDV